MSRIRNRRGANQDLDDVVDQLGHAATAKRIPGTVIGTSETRVPHGLTGRPVSWWTGDHQQHATVRQTQDPDAQFLYLAASAALTCTVWVT